ncbi:hypothetical protein [Sorangium sp. So ce1151]|uniref:hypothetical protein n=1 Tax=Sorangium sp. So ce1151 TaxID=3133332 RepID=UPI003F63461E
MRVSSNCPVCVSAAAARNAPPAEIQRLCEQRVEGFITHERSVAVTCLSGHRFGIVITEPAYALVFERGLQRLVNGELRDAVLDMYTALDMYMPTVPVRARYDRDASLTLKDIPRLRKEFGFAVSDANKALGAAFAVAAVVSGKSPPKFDSKLSKLRNRAVHAGEYPTAEEAEWAAMEVERIVTTLMDMLNEAASDRDPSFRLAVSMVDFPVVEPRPVASMSLGLGAVLSEATTPRETVRRRLERYRNGELRNIRLY